MACKHAYLDMCPSVRAEEGRGTAKDLSGQVGGW